MRNPTPNRSQAQTSPDQIAKEAFLIWCDEGRPEGRAEEHWRQAEERLAVHTAVNPGQPGRFSSPSQRGI